MIGRPQEVTEFNGGLITDRDAALLNGNQSPSITNADLRFRAGLRKLPGSADWKDSLPASVTPKRITEIQFSLPSSQQVTVLYGKNGSDHQLWTRPHVNLSGSWVDEWQELTEREGSAASPLVAASGSAVGSLKLTGLGDTTTDYYKGWYAYDLTTEECRVVTASTHSAGTWTLTLNFDLQADPTGDNIILVRNQVIDRDGAYLFSPQDDEVEFLHIDNGFIVLTGSDTAYPSASDLHCAYIDQSLYNDTDYDWKGINCGRNSVHAIFTSDFLSASDVIEATDPVPNDTYLIEAVLVYDGYQEGPIYAGAIYEDGFQVGKRYVRQVVCSGDRIDVELLNSHLLASLGHPPAMDNNNSSDLVNHIATDRRVTGIRVYMASAEDVGSSYYMPTEEWRFVREVTFNSSSWTWDAAQERFEQTISIYGRDYQDAAIADLPSGVDSEDRQGHTDFHVYGNARHGAVSGNRVFYGNLHIDKQRESYLLSTPINSDGLNTPSVLAWTSFAYDANVNGISEIVAMVNVLNRLVVLGKTDLLRINPSIVDASFSVSDQYRDIGGLSKISLVVVGGILYFASDKGIMAYIPNTSQVIDTSLLSDISEGAIQNVWRDLGVSVREATAFGWSKTYNYLVLSNSSGTWAFHLGDKNWVYYGSTQYSQFTTGIDGELLGITSGGEVKELFAATPDESTSLSYTSPVFYGPFKISGFKMKYKSDVAITVAIKDGSTGQTRKSLTFPAQSAYSTYTAKKFDVKVDQFQFTVTSAAATTNDIDILSMTPIVTPLTVTAH